jgi:hypothetical protein
VHVSKMSVRAWRQAAVAGALLTTVVSSAPGGSGNYLIVTASEYDGSAPLNQFIAAKTAQGFDVTTYTAAVGTSRDTIKAYIKSLWGTSDAPDYILLIGDAASSTATTTRLPYWSGGGSKEAPTDLPYACMDEGDDWHPEITIGRFSVESVNMLQNVVEKTLFVEAGDFPDPDYARRGAFVANPDTYGMAEPTHDWVIENYFEPNEYEAIKIYRSQGGDTQDIADALNRGCLWTVYYGHSYPTGWYDPPFYQSDVQALTNEGLYGVITSHSCSVGDFTLNDCFGEMWLREADKGAAAVIFPSDYIYWDSAEEWLPSTVLEHSWFRAFFEDDIWEVGPAWQAALYHFEQDYDGDVDVERNFFEEFNLLGDPSLCLPHVPNPMFVSPGDDLVSEGPVGGPFVPDSITYGLRNKADYAIDYEVTGASAAWVTLSGDLSGTLPPDGTAEVTVQINSTAETLRVGSYDDTVYFTNLTDHIGDTTRGVLLQVGVPELKHSWTFEAEPGWSTEGQWAFGQPTGGGGQYGGPDPTSGYSGPYVYGYNLEGDYENNLPERHLTSDAIDCTYLTRVSLRFWRWLGVEQPVFDHAYVRVSTNGLNWTTIWENAEEVTDYSWQPQELDISDIADSQPTVYLRWTMGPTDDAWHYCGWNLDDVELWAVLAIPGDLDGDGCVDQVDLGVLLADWGCSGEGCPGDCDNDGDTDQSDLGILLAHWNEGCP